MPDASARERSLRRVPRAEEHRMGAPFSEADAADFEGLLERTSEALRQLALHWKDTEAGTCARSLLESRSSRFSDEGFQWCQEVGLSLLLPTDALNCKPVNTSIGRDGLSASTAGGPPLPTHRGLLVAPSPPCGFGVFATCKLQKGEKLGEYTGEIRSYDVWLDEIKNRKLKAHGSPRNSPFIREELYAAWSGMGPRSSGVVVDAFSYGNTMRFVNCSCKPNCSFKNFGTSCEQHSRLHVVPTRDIEIWEQLSVDYGWYSDPPTLEAVREEATLAYMKDLPDLQMLQQLASGSKDACHQGAHSEAVQVLIEALCETPSSSSSKGFLRRFCDETQLRRFVEEGGRFEQAADYTEIPDPVWFLYEVVGGERVGISCRCGLDPSLNSSGQCSGIIGRPLQADHSGRHEAEEEE
eukprot:TRINITY_DN63740_c0_g1_i1.p1 TRINITY_DN63740_c0_g1~~TRINITY_DN63740_c0_g1_i1.p1  ORF type:complete len:424 (-),score=74.01 TRINITY_DN63740_c0_g1_i1:29-1258(-)